MRQIETWPNRETLIAFHELARWGWSVEEIAGQTCTTAQRVEEILNDEGLRRDAATLLELREWRWREMLAASGGVVELHHWRSGMKT